MSEEDIKAIKKETGDLLEAIMRLCEAADFHESSLTALTLAIQIIADQTSHNPCCVLSQMFNLYTQPGVPDAENPTLLFTKFVQHLVDEKKIEAKLIPL